MTLPLILLLMSRSDIRHKFTTALKDRAHIAAADAIDETLAEIKWNSVEAVLIDMTDNDIDGYANLDIINSTYPSIAVFLIVDKNADNSQFEKHESNIVLGSNLSPEEITEIIFEKISDQERQEISDKEQFIIEMTRYRNNVRRVEDYVGMEIENALREETVSAKNLSFLSRVNVGLEGFLQLQIEGRDEE